MKYIQSAHISSIRADASLQAPRHANDFNVLEYRNCCCSVALADRTQVTAVMSGFRISSVHGTVVASISTKAIGVSSVRFAIILVVCEGIFTRARLYCIEVMVPVVCNPSIPVQRTRAPYRKHSVNAPITANAALTCCCCPMVVSALNAFGNVASRCLICDNITGCHSNHVSDIESYVHTRI